MERSVPNAPCGVESLERLYSKFALDVPFLMRRVELKVLNPIFNRAVEFIYPVPNAPCGVERKEKQDIPGYNLHVPNAPCGVESEDEGEEEDIIPYVPNAPCGVESGFDKCSFYMV